jgi:hypothetical protein
MFWRARIIDFSCRLPYPQRSRPKIQAEDAALIGGKRDNGCSRGEEKSMDSGLLASLDWGALALVAVVAAALAWGMVFFLRQNRKDLDDLQPRGFSGR